MHFQSTEHNPYTSPKTSSRLVILLPFLSLRERFTVVLIPHSSPPSIRQHSHCVSGVIAAFSSCVSVEGWAGSLGVPALLTSLRSDEVGENDSMCCFRTRELPLSTSSPSLTPSPECHQKATTSENLL
ncbi:hypothetical protein AOLI_G00135150 [Acnodon oligacanthus]